MISDMTAVHTKDTLLRLISEANDDIRLLNIEHIVVDSLTHCQGFWVECRYCYKASEIAKRAKDEVQSMLDETSNHKRVQRLESVRDKLRRLEDHYYRLQHTLNSPAAA